MSSITPTVGRKVWFYVSPSQLQPIDATVVKVIGDGPDAAVNLDTIDPDTGEHHFWSGLVVGDETTRVPHYRWMPYQQGQAAKAAA
jgi:hypothetical protein